MRKTMASALFLLGMTCASLPMTGRAESKTKNYSAATTQADSLSYQQELDVIQDRIPLTWNRYVQKYVDLYTKSQKARFSRVLGLSKYYFPIYEKVFRERNVPEDLKYISVIESSLDPEAVSHVGATGLWQFLYETGKIYGLNIDDRVDERKDPVRASNAAASYLLDSYFLYDDWLLAIASFNCGRNNIKWAIEKAGGQKDFWAIRPYLPVETQNYVPAFIATAYVMNNYRKYNITPADPGVALNREVISLNKTISLHQAANSSVSTERPFNHRVANGETLLSIAARYRIKVEDLTAWNQLKTTEIIPGQMIKVLSDRIPSGKQINDSYVSYTVKPGDTLSSIVLQFSGATEEEIRVVNRLNSSSVRPGMILKIIGG